MTYVALLEGVAIIATALTFAGLLRSMVRQQARERDMLLNKIMHLAGRTWEPPPAHVEPAQVDDDLALAAAWDPSQLPDDYLQ